MAIMNDGIPKFDISQLVDNSANRIIRRHSTSSPDFYIFILGSVVDLISGDKFGIFDFSKASKNMRTQFTAIINQLVIACDRVITIGLDFLDQASNLCIINSGLPL
jgi:hypothetical protein